MVKIVEIAENKKIIYYQTDIECQCEIKVIENGENIIINYLHLVPNVRYFTNWTCGWYDKTIIFTYDGCQQEEKIFGTNIKYDSKKYSKHVEDIVIEEITELCQIMSKYGSDKSGKPSHGRLPGHNYTRYYYKLFNDIKNKNINFFELGMGTNNPNLSSNMTEDGLPGASLRGWLEFFNKGKIFGADIDTEILFDDENIKTFFCDQTNPKIIKQLWNQKDLDFEFDVIIEDGLHEFNANKTFLENSIHKLKKGGYFIIEDINIDEIYSWCDYFEVFEKENIEYEIKFVRLFCNHNRHDNNLIVIKKYK